MSTRILMLFGALALVLTILTKPALAAEDEEWEEPAPPTDAEIKKMKIKVLKAFLADRGLTCDDCFEKGDYVRFVKKNRAAPLLPSRRPRKISKEPIQDQWKKETIELCKAAGADDATCKPLWKVVMGSFEIHGRRVKNQLHIEAHMLAKTTFDSPYLEAGQTLVKKTLAWMIANKITKQDDIRKKLDNKIKMYLTAAGAHDVNPMYTITNNKNKDEL